MWSAALFITAMPVAVDPVKVTLSTPGSAVSAAPVSPAPVTTLKTPGGNPASSTSLANSRVDERCLLGRFGDEGASGGQRGRQLARQQKQRAVPGQDGGDDADGLAAGVGEEVRLRRGDGGPEDLVGGAGEELVGRGQSRHLPAGLANHLAVVGGFDPRKFVGVRCDQGRQSADEITPVCRRHRSPWSRQRPPGGLYCFAHVGRTGQRRGGPGFAGVGVDGFEGFAGHRIDPLAVDVHLSVLQAAASRFGDGHRIRGHVAPYSFRANWFAGAVGLRDAAVRR